MQGGGALIFCAGGARSCARSGKSSPLATKHFPNLVITVFLNRSVVC
jgi:hypothetical protein